MSKEKETQIDIVDVLMQNQNKNGKVTEKIELITGEEAITNVGDDKYGVRILSVDARREDGSLCRMAFKGEKLINEINEKGWIEDGKIYMKLEFRLKKSDGITHFVSTIHEK